MNNLIIVFQVRKDGQLYAMYCNCEFKLSSVAFIGHILSSKGVRLDPRKMEAVKSWSKPLSLPVFKPFGVRLCIIRCLLRDFHSSLLHLRPLL